MNQISAIQITGDFDPYLQFAIDGEAVDNMLEETCPGFDILYLVPTLDRSLETKEERNIVWHRIFPENGTSVCPILMCEDDRDFFCKLIVAEIEIQDNTVLWKRIGLDRSSPNNLQDVGTTVQWFKTVPSFQFDKVVYQKMLEKFRSQYEEDDRVLREKGYT